MLQHLRLVISVHSRIHILNILNCLYLKNPLLPIRMQMDGKTLALQKQLKRKMAPNLNGYSQPRSCQFSSGKSIKDKRQEPREIYHIEFSPHIILSYAILHGIQTFIPPLSLCKTHTQKQCVRSTLARITERLRHWGKHLHKYHTLCTAQD